MANPQVVYHFDIQQNTDEWYKLRRGIITASAFSALITKTGKPADSETSRAYLYQLLCERLTDIQEESYYNNDMARGHMLEPAAREIYSNYVEEVTECGFITRAICGGTIGCSPDGLVGKYGMIQIKSPRAKKHIATILSGEVPSEYIIQIQTELAVSGRKWNDFISFCPGLPFFVKRVYRDQEMIDNIINCAEQAERSLKDIKELYLWKAVDLAPTEPITLNQGDIII